MKLVDLPRKGKSEPVSVRLILVEEDASGFESPRPSAETEPTLEVVVLMQSRGEPSAEFLERTRRRIAALERADRSVGEAIVALGPAYDHAALDARLEGARSLLAHMTRFGHGELVLMAGSSAPDARHELFDLAGRLTSETSESVSIRVVFDAAKREPERKSGIQALLAPTRGAAELDEVLAAG